MDRVSYWLAVGVEWLQGYGLVAPVVQLLLATLFGFVFAERWQRWRQRRDFQYRTLVKFSELSYDMMLRLSELLLVRDVMTLEMHIETRREMVSRWIVFASMRPEVMASFGRRLLLSEDFQGMFNALDNLQVYAGRSDPVPQRTSFGPEVERFLAHREAVVAEMGRAMGLVSRRDHRAEMDSAHAQVQAARRVEE